MAPARASKASTVPSPVSLVGVPVRASTRYSGSWPRSVTCTISAAPSAVQRIADTERSQLPVSERLVPLAMSRSTTWKRSDSKPARSIAR